MKKIKKKVREKGKIKFSEYFKNLKEGDKVAVLREPSVRAVFPKRMQGKTGVIESMRGKAYVVRINDLNEEKRLIVNAVHLKKLK